MSTISYHKSNGKGVLSVTCPIIVPTFGAELLSNGDMETGNPPTGWSATGSGASPTLSAETVDPYAGSQALRVTMNAGGTYEQGQKGTTLAVGNWIQGTAYCKRGTGTDQAFSVDRIVNTSYPGIPAGGYTLMRVIGPVITANPLVHFYCNRGAGAAGNYILGDSASAKQITFSSMLAFISRRVSKNGTYQCKPIVRDYSQAGLIIEYKDANNFVLAWVLRDDAGRARLIKCVAGVYTSVISSTITYVESGVLKVIVNGQSHSLFYNGSQVGTTQSIDTSGMGKDVYGFNAFDTNEVGLVTLSPALS